MVSLGLPGKAEVISYKSKTVIRKRRGYVSTGVGPRTGISITALAGREGAGGAREVNCSPGSGGMLGVIPCQAPLRRALTSPSNCKYARGRRGRTYEKINKPGDESVQLFATDKRIDADAYSISKFTVKKHYKAVCATYGIIQGSGVLIRLGNKRKNLAGPAGRARRRPGAARARFFPSTVVFRPVSEYSGGPLPFPSFRSPSINPPFIAYPFPTQETGNIGDSSKLESVHRRNLTNKRTDFAFSSARDEKPRPLPPCTLNVIGHRPGRGRGTGIAITAGGSAGIKTRRVPISESCNVLFTRVKSATPRRRLIKTARLRRAPVLFTHL
ncbi:hypothetical protein EVAR_64353_1 [Eumeta japonica]|uniref:Uncharacterized protein n=1 Tax=Eumeta variegata TaxID=151549 RepID=A0A4C1ZNX5_EUMVA|nr:hypothetical protein EVAR_64353_1 [Eumeta japonica]